MTETSLSARALRSIQTVRGIARSMRIYYGQRSHLRRMQDFYAAIVKPGDLVFDIGAHVGDRVLAFRRLGCRVVALEPQPGLVRLLRKLHRGPSVTIVAAAIDDQPGVVKLHLNTKNPTVATASEDFIAAAQAGAPGWHGQAWDDAIVVPAVTLDSLIELHGEPAFVKIDVEGLEDRALAGLSRPLKALSFEFTTHRREVALACIDRLGELAAYRFNACLGESWISAFPENQCADAIRAWIEGLPDEANSGDIYCFRVDRSEGHGRA